MANKKRNRMWNLRKLPIAAGIIALIAIMSATSGVSAEQLMMIPPEMRLKRGTSEINEASSHVTITQLHASQLPSFILSALKARVFTCGLDQGLIGKVTAYSWTSDWSRSHHHPPSYLIDFNSLANESTNEQPPTNDMIAPDSNCKIESVCNKEGCLIYGFTATSAKRWKQDFELRANAFQFIEEKEQDDEKRTHIVTNAIKDKEECQASGGKYYKGNNCLRWFAWRSYGLSALPAPEN